MIVERLYCRFHTFPSAGYMFPFVVRYESEIVAGKLGDIILILRYKRADEFKKGLSA